MNTSYSTEHSIDKYGRTTEISGLVANTYDVLPVYYTFENASDNRFNIIDFDNANSKLFTSTDLKTGTVTKFAYDEDVLERVESFNSSGTSVNHEEFSHDDLDRLTSNTFTYGDHSVGSTYSYVKEVTDDNPDNRIGACQYKVDDSIKATVANTFDVYKRLKTKTVTIGSAVYEKELFYDKTRISRVVDEKGTTTIGNVYYGYDELGRITKKSESAITDSTPDTYVYDSFGQLIRENNLELDKTILYEYNGIGNVTSVKAYAYTTAETPTGDCTEQSYTYDTVHPDRLTHFETYPVSYDSLGCISSHRGFSYEWSNGKLSRMHFGSPSQPGTAYMDVRFTYDGYGRRNSKTYIYDVNPGSTSDYSCRNETIYTYDSSGRLVRETLTETKTSDGGSSITREFVYLYDESGVIGFMFGSSLSNLNPYYFQKNIFGDVIAIYSQTGNKLVEYAYDAYGNCSIIYSGSQFLATRNPFRYRGYYYDQDTGLYYLNARYYDPQWRRFISPDDTSYLDPESVNGLNLYAYCNNDPVNYCDPSGNSVILTMALILMGVGVAAGLGYAAYTDYQDDYDVNGSVGWQTYLGSAMIGGALGFGIGYFGPQIASFLSSNFTLGYYALAGEELVAITVSGAQIAGGAIAATGIGLTYFAYESKKAAPRIRSNTKKQAYDKAFHKGGKRKPILHQNGKYGPHFHPANPKYKHWHFYFSFILAILGIDMEDFD